MFCWKCGSQLRDGVAFCPMCGAQQSMQENKPGINLEFGFDDGSDKKTQNSSGNPGQTDAPEMAGAGQTNQYGYQSQGGYQNPNTDRQTSRSQTSSRETAYQQAQRARKNGPPSVETGAKLENGIEMGAGIIGFVFLIPFLFGILRFLTYRLTILFRSRFFWTLTRFLGTLGTIVVVLLLIASIVEIAGLVYLMVKRQGQDIIPVIIAIVVSALVLLTSILYLSRVVLALRVILIIAAIVLGLDLFVKVFIEKTGLNGTFNLAQDFASLKAKMAATKEPVDQRQYTDPNIPRYELTPQIENGESYFDGKGVELFGLQILLGLLTAVTCSLATPWVLVKKLKWVTSHTVIEGKRQDFNGTAMELFGHWIKWLLLSIITCGLYLYYAHIDYMKWVCKHTTYLGREMPGGNEYRDSFYDGSFAEYLGTGILAGLLSGITCGIGYPWAFTMQKKFDVKSTVIGGDRYFYDGTGGSLFGTWIGHALLTIITCGIYSAWMECALNRYYVCHTHIDATYRHQMR